MNDLTVVYYTDIHCIIDIKKEIEMTNYETLQQICERAKENIDMLNASGKLDALSKCIAFVDDLHKWVSYCDNLKNYILVEEAQTECINSIYMCAQGFYKEAMTTLRQFLSICCSPFYCRQTITSIDSGKSESMICHGRKL